MQVYANNFQLTGDDPAEQVDKYQSTQSNDVEVAKKFRANVADVFDRGNQITSISFNVGKEHPTEADAFDYSTRLMRTVPRNGPVTIIKLVMQGHGETIKRSYQGAVETIGATEVIGIYTVATFKITLGVEITTK